MRPVHFKGLVFFKFSSIGFSSSICFISLTVNKENENAIKVYEEFGFKVKSIAYSMQI